MIKFITRKYHVIEARDLNELVKSTYNRNYEFEADAESSGNSYYALHAYVKAKIEAYDQKKLNEFLATGKFSYLYGTLIQDLVSKGLIPEGNLLVTTS